MKTNHMKRIPWNKGIKTGIVPKSAFKKGCVPTEETLNKRRITRSGYRHSEETKKKISDSHKGIVTMKGESHYKWKTDRTTLAKRQERNDVAYKEWRKQVWLRDKFTCKIANPDCKGRIEAHHILGWKGYPELRYQVNNGITLCHAHHPRKRTEEAKLSPYFQKLVAEMN